jgi:hypothetical protein
MLNCQDSLKSFKKLILRNVSNYNNNCSRKKNNKISKKKFDIKRKERKGQATKKPIK